MRRNARKIGFAVAALAALGIILVVVYRRRVTPNPPVTITIDAAVSRHPISLYIYGVARGKAADVAGLNCPLNRLGGESASCYNWQLNADNRGRDWFYESIGYKSPIPGQWADNFIAACKAGNVEAAIPVPMLGWVAKLGPKREKLASFSVARYGRQKKTDPYWSDAGNGVLTDGTRITHNDPNDANMPAAPSFQKGWVEHIVSRWGAAAKGGVRFYVLDNEPSIWFTVHRDVCPHGPTMEEVKNRIVQYASMIKSVDPTAFVVGPEEWGWQAYLYSGADQEYGRAHGWKNLPDRSRHGGQDYLPWLLSQLRQEEEATGRRLLDVFSVHYYPQGGEYSDDTSTAMQLRRNRSTRSLWDRNYVDESWIKSKVYLIPRMKEWINAFYPGTKTAITEYNWGAENCMNGATAQADVLGIFGREGLDTATRWATPKPSTPVYKAIQMYRNYDGGRSTFGDTSVSASVPDPDDLSAFAAVRSSDGALTIIVISKYLSGRTPLRIRVADFDGGVQAQVWQLTAANAIRRKVDIPFNGSALQATVPPQSITLFIIPSRRHS